LSSYKKVSLGSSVAVLGVLGVGALFVGLFVGPGLGVDKLAELFAGNGLLAGIFQLRLGRTLLALLVGAALGLAGAALQGLTRNPLADPFLTGVSAGAGVGVAVAALVGIGSATTLGYLGRQGLAFVSGVGAALLVWRLSGGGRFGRNGLIVAGVVVNATLSGLILVILSWLPIFSQGAVLGWLWGDLSTPYIRWWPMLTAAVLTVGGGVYLFWRAPALDALALGEEQAHSLGINLRRGRRGILLAAALLTASATALGGIIPFVGLVAPHLVRVRAGAGHRRLLPLTALTGAVLVLVADNVVRLAVNYLSLPSLPLGAALALLGGPYFFAVYRKMGKKQLL